MAMFWSSARLNSASASRKVSSSSEEMAVVSVRMRLDRGPGAKLALAIGGRTIPLTPGENATLALRNAGRTEVSQASLVFGGYGVVDLARGWDA